MKNKIKLFREQFSQCTQDGLTKETEFFSFEKYPEFLPAFPNELMRKDISSGKWAGIDRIKCGKFGGFCNSHNEKCMELRGFK